MKIDKSLPVKRITPTDGHYFFGYYDIQPFDINGKFHLTHKTTFCDKLQERGDIAEIGFIDDKGKYEKLAITGAWNFQQGAMLQWNPLAPDKEIIYNDLVDGKNVCVVMDITTGKKRYLDMAVANVSKDGKFALAINMSRMYDFRPGYGYAEPADLFYYRKHSKDDGVFLIDMKTGKAKLILSLDEIWNFSGSFFSKDEKMIINHITFNTDGSRFLALVRNFPPKGEGHKTAIITASRDGSDMYLLSDYGVQSHYWWLNESEVLFYSDGKELDCCMGWGNNYVLKDKTHEGYIQANGFFEIDNHMSFSPDQNLMITDSYPNDTGHQVIMLYDPHKNLCVDLGYFYSMPNVCTDVRCDLHPRWNRKGNGITFDSTHEGFRGIYKINLDKETVDSLFSEN